VSEDERALLKRLAALESEVKAEAEAQAVQKARKQAAVDRLRAEQAAKQAEREAARPKAKRVEHVSADDVEVLPAPSKRRRSPAADLGDALELVGKAQGVRAELTKPKKKGDKSWKVAAALSTVFGPLGWLYAGSWREAAPASAVWLAFFYLTNLILPFVLFLPALMIALPLSGIAGTLYALSYNREGSRQRLFTEDKKPKALASSDDE
jgi:hypothetical protein